MAKIGQYARAAKGALPYLQGWGKAGLTDNGIKQIKRELDKPARTMISFATTMMLLSKMGLGSVTLILNVIGLVIAGITGYLSFGVENSNAISLVIFMIFAGIYVVTSLSLFSLIKLYDGAEKMDEKFGLSSTGVEMPGLIITIILLARITTAPFYIVRLVYDLLVSLMKIAFNSGNSALRTINRGKVTCTVMLPNGVNADFDALIDEERYYATSNFFNRAMDSFEDASRESTTNALRDKKIELENSKKTIEDAYMNDSVSKEDYSEMVVKHNDLVNEYNQSIDNLGREDKMEQITKTMK